MKYTSMRGESIDAAKYLAQNGDEVAVGNLKMNARGDLLGPGGKVIKTKEEASMEYNRSNPKAVKHVPLRNIEQEIFTPEQAVAKAKEDMSAKAAQEGKARRKITQAD